MIEFKTLVVRDELEAAMVLLPSIPQDQMNAVARFLESKGLVKEALGVALDPEYKCVRERRERGRSQADSGWEAREAREGSSMGGVWCKGCCGYCPSNHP